MARIRSIKPGFCTSEAIAALTIPCRLHFAMLWTYADDAGRGLDNARLIKAALWPLDDEVGVSAIEEWQQELDRNGRMVRYEDDGRRYFEISNFTEHQKPNRPAASTIPAPQGALTAPTVSAHEQRIPVVVVESSGEEQEQERRRLTRDERNDRFVEAIELLLLRDGSTKEATSKASPTRWLAAARRGRSDDHHDAGHKHLAKDPSLSAEALADLLEPSMSVVSGWETCGTCQASYHPNSAWGQHECTGGAA